MIPHQKTGRAPDIAFLDHEQALASDGHTAHVNRLTKLCSVASSESEKPLALPYLEPSVVDSYGKEPPGRGDGRTIIEFSKELDVTKVMLVIEEIALLVTCPACGLDAASETKFRQRAGAAPLAIR